MKTVYIIRHAKSTWANIGQRDFDRPLNERGHKDAPAMAERLLNKKIEIDSFISSPAKRARQTCEHFYAVLGKGKDPILFIDELYHAPCETFYTVIGEMEDKYERIAIFSHNPGITEFVNSLTNSVRLDNMPTCGIFCITVNSNTWSSFKQSEKKFEFFDYPKAL
jgi:phosphohistidine phosphatase